MRRAVLLPAAGASSRMRGRDKLLEDVGGIPCLRHMAQAALMSADLVIVTLPEANHPRARALQGLPVLIIPVPDHATGMSASLRAGAGAAISAQADALMVLPADMPALAPHMANLWEAYAKLPVGRLLRASTTGGKQGHPVIFPQELLKQFQSLKGDRGAEPILQQFAERLSLHALPDAIARHDLNTPEDWAQWRHASSSAE